MIRDATARDIPQLCGLMSDFYSETPHTKCTINPEAAEKNFQLLIDADNVFLKVIDMQGLLVGAACAERSVEPWTLEAYTFEHFIYVLPKHRNGYQAGRLLVDMVDWAKGTPCVIRVQASSGIDGDRAARLYDRMGLKPRGSLYGMESF